MEKITATEVLKQFGFTGYLVSLSDGTSYPSVNTLEDAIDLVRDAANRAKVANETVDVTAGVGATPVVATTETEVGDLTIESKRTLFTAYVWGLLADGHTCKGYAGHTQNFHSLPDYYEGIVANIHKDNVIIGTAEFLFVDGSEDDAIKWVTDTMREQRTSGAYHYTLYALSEGYLYALPSAFTVAGDGYNDNDEYDSDEYNDEYDDED